MSRSISGLRAAFAGMCALAVAMGVGRFAFTPVLPMMQTDAGLTLKFAGWLAAANYIGYFLGALSAIRLRVREAVIVRTALLAVVVLTAGMGFTHSPAVWLVLRGLAGVASAWVLVFASAWSLQMLATLKQPRLGGTVFGGVGLGIMLAGGLCLVLLHFSANSELTWIALGLLALVLMLPTGPIYRATPSVDHNSANRDQPPPGGRRYLLPAICYGVFGFGYIIPATFLPAMAKRIIPDPAIFGWTWPLFGLAALLSPLLAGRLGARFTNRRIWAVAQLLMAVGVILPVIWTNIVAIGLAALCVGGTFMVITLAGLQEARRLAPQRPAGLMAVMTSMFAVGQILGPVLVSVLAGKSWGFTLALAVATVLLAASALALWRSRQTADAGIAVSKKSSA